MAGFLDLFSSHAACYARARPGYPPELFAYLASLSSRRRLAWDVGTGNGQAAIGLAGHFDCVIATDASASQLTHARPHERITYRTAPAEASGLDDASVDIVTVAQALHWFNHEAFYAEVRRVLSAGGHFAAWCYTLPRVNAAIDTILDRFYHDVTGPYWEAGRRYIDERYETIPFPFDESTDVPVFAFHCQWTLTDYLAYVESWSAVQTFRQRNQRDPLDTLRIGLTAAWVDANQARPIAWPIHLRVGATGRPASTGLAGATRPPTLR